MNASIYKLGVYGVELSPQIHFGSFNFFLIRGSVLGRQNLCCGNTRSLLWQDKMCVVARQHLCCAKTRSLLWQDIKEAALGRLHKGGRRFAPPPFVDPFMSCHNRDFALPQQRCCIATTHILSCHNRDLVLPQQRLCLPRAESRNVSRSGPAEVLRIRY